MSCFQDKKISVTAGCGLIGVSLMLMPLKMQAQRTTAHRVIRSEIDGVPLVRTEGAPKYEGPLFAIEDDLAIGLPEGEPEWQVFWASPFILVAPDGRMVLIDHRRCEVFVVSPEGELLARTGGPGSGPGEFRQPWFYDWDIHGEVVLIDDRALNRATRLSMAGELLSTLNYGTVMGREWQYFFALGNGRYLGYSQTGDEVRHVGQPYETIKRFYWLDTDLNTTGEFMVLPNRTGFATSEYTGSQIPYTRVVDIVPFPDGRLLYLEPDIGRLTIMTAEGEPFMHIEREWERPRISPAEREAVRRRYAENEQEYMRRVANRIPFPSRYPAYSIAFADDRGRLWVEYVLEPYPASRTADYMKYDVFGPDGVWLGVQEFTFYPQVISGDHVYHRGALTEDGCPGFQRFDLRPLVPEAAGEVRRSGFLETFRVLDGQDDPGDGGEEEPQEEPAPDIAPGALGPVGTEDPEEEVDVSDGGVISVHRDHLPCGGYGVQELNRPVPPRR